MSDQIIRKVSFIGVGNMGGAMAENLVQRGFSLTVYDADSAKAQAFAQSHHARAVDRAADTARGADAVILMLPNDGVVRSVLFDHVLADHLATGSIVIDMGTSSPSATREISEQLAAKGIYFLDAPVMGGVVFARDASLDIMVGGDLSLVERCRPLFEAMGRRVWPCGAVGNAQVLKVMTNYINACALANTLEAMVVAKKYGLDSAMVAEAIDVMCNGRQHPVVKKVIPHVLTRKYATGMTMQLIAKDVNIAVDTALNVGAVIPLGEATAKIWRDSCDQLGGSRDQTEIVRYWELAAQTHL